jgi:AcrR family transcriptional regulator
MGGSTLVDRAVDEKVVHAALSCFARWGVAKTTLDDIAREAGVSRATIYRQFPGGKDVVLDAVAGRELAQFFAGLRDEMDRTVARPERPSERDTRPERPSERETRLEDLLVAGITFTTRAIREHAALQFLLAHEPEVVLPLVAFDRLDVVLDHAAAFCAPYLEPHVGKEWAPRAGEWITRMVLSYSLVPSDGFDLAVEVDARRFVRCFITPGLTTP